MSFKDDIEEIKQLWSNATLPTKSLIVISVFISSSSLTSLSDVVFGWKGFILDALVFYREHVSSPIVSFAARLGLNYTDQAVDIIIVYSILVGTALRAYWIKSTNQTHITHRVTRTVGWIVSLIIAIVVFSETAGFHGLYPVILLLMVGQYITEPYTPGLEYSKSGKILWYMPLAGVLSLLLLLGAINSGLSR